MVKREIREFKIDLSSVPRLFNVNDPSMLCARDIIAYVRGTIEKDPWVPVVLVTKEKAFALEEFEGSHIYWKDVNDEKAGDISSLSVDTYCVVRVEDLTADKEDCGLLDVIDSFRNTHNVKSFSVLIVGEDDKAEQSALLSQLRQFVVEHAMLDVIFPRFITVQNKLLPNGFDIAPAARKIESYLLKNELTYSVLDEVLAEILPNITEGVTAIQDLDEERSLSVRLLSLYLTLKYKLPPVYVTSFIVDYVEMQVFYPFKSLSLYERVNFLYRMPKVIGYLGNNQGFNCLAAVNKKIFPLPHYVFNLTKGKLEPDVARFALDSPGMRFADFRSHFKESENVFLPRSSAKNAVSSISDSDLIADRKLVEAFMKLSRSVTEEPVFLSVKNCILASRQGERFLLYCPEECGVEVTLMSEYFGLLPQVLTEKDFPRIIDAQIEKALLGRSRAGSVSKGITALATQWKQFDESLALRPAIPLDTVLYMKLLPVYKNGLSYYDTHLRCCTDILPIITSTDSSLWDVSPLFKHMSLEALRGDPLASAVVNCFGTLSNSTGSDSTLAVTYEAFSEGGML